MSILRVVDMNLKKKTHFFLTFRWKLYWWVQTQFRCVDKSWGIVKQGHYGNILFFLFSMFNFVYIYSLFQ